MPTAKNKPQETFSRYDTADYLTDKETILAYLEAAIEEAEEDPSIIPVALGNIARARNMSQLARDTGLTREGLYKALSSDGNPAFVTVLKVAHAMGLQLTFRHADSA